MKIQFRVPGLTVFESALFRTTSTVVETPDLILLVDPNWLPQEVKFIQQYVDAIRQNRPLYLLFTHSDYDHILGYGAFPNAKTIASGTFVQNPDKASILQQIQQFDANYYLKRDYEIVYPDIDFAIEKDEDTLTFGTTKLTFYQAPGHNADGLFTIVEPLGAWLAGDYLSNVEFPYIYHSSLDYEATLAKAEKIIQSHQLNYLIPGHGDVTTASAHMQTRLQESRDYITQLRASVQGQQAFDENALWQRYEFRLGMQAFHEKNKKLMQKEQT